MKDKLIVTLCAVTIFLLGFLTARAWGQELSRQQVAKAHAESAAYYQEQMREQAHEAEKARVKSVCENSLAIYDKLAPTQQKTIPRPQCDLGTVE